jgi:hypothetical protein
MPAGNRKVLHAVGVEFNRNKTVPHFLSRQNIKADFGGRQEQNFGDSDWLPGFANDSFRTGFSLGFAFKAQDVQSAREFIIDPRPRGSSPACLSRLCDGMVVSPRDRNRLLPDVPILYSKEPTDADHPVYIV